MGNMSVIRYDVYVSREADFFPSASSLVATVYGATETVVTNLEPGLRYYVKVMATDGDGNSSLETKPLSIKMSYQSFVSRDDVNIYLAEDFLANPVFDDDNAAIQFDITEEFLPDVGDYLILNPDQGALVYRVESMDLVTGAANVGLTGSQVNIGLAPADVRELAASGNLNSAISYDANSGGVRYYGHKQSSYWRRQNHCP